MKKLLYLALLFFSLQLSAQNNKNTLKNEVVEAACGQCQLGKEGHGCDLAIRYKQNVYYVDGTSIDSHGDAHSHDGFCNAIRKAEVSGEITENRFKATSFILIKEQKTDKK